MPDTYRDTPAPDTCCVCGDPTTGPRSGVVTAAAIDPGRLVLLHQRCATLVQSLSEDAVRVYTRRARVAAAARMIGRPVPPRP